MSKKSKKQNELTVPFWIVDGFVGVLALMIYNFLLYILTVMGVKGIINQMEDAMGYFGLNSFIDFNFGPATITIGLIFVFIISFFLGIIIGKFVRKRKKYKGRKVF